MDQGWCWSMVRPGLVARCTNNLGPSARKVAHEHLWRREQDASAWRDISQSRPAGGATGGYISLAITLLHGRCRF